MEHKQPKLKECAVCGAEFPPTKTTQRCCGWKCAIEFADQKKKKDFKKRTRREKKEFYLHDRKYQLKQAQAACNAYIRERDKDEPCISCGTTNPSIQYCAGHFRTVGSTPELRFHPLNIHKQCNKNCNLEKSGNIALYRPNLIDRIGQVGFDWVENNQSKHKYTLDDIIAIKEYYKEQLKILKKESES